MLTQITFVVQSDLAEEMKKYTEEMKITRSKFIKRAIIRYVKKLRAEHNQPMREEPEKLGKDVMEVPQYPEE